MRTKINHSSRFPFLRLLCICAGSVLFIYCGTVLQAEPRLAAGGKHSIIIAGDGGAWGWGSNERGQLGNGDTVSLPMPVRVTGGHEFLSVAAGAAHTVAISVDGVPFAWGRNSEGQLGVGDFNDRGTPVRVGVESGWESVAAGKFHTLGIREGRIYAWGSNAAGQLGEASVNRAANPVPVGGEGRWIAVAAGEFHSLAVRDDGTLWSWGNNLEGQLGVGSGISVANAPVQVGNAGGWASVAAGSWHSVAIRDDGALYAWGRNSEGQLGLGPDSSKRFLPVKVGAADDWESVEASGNFSIGLRKNGALYTWGSNRHGQLADGTGVQRVRPLKVGETDDWVGIAAGGGHSLFLRENGRAYAGGLNSEGQLGRGYASSDVLHTLDRVMFNPADSEDGGISLAEALNQPDLVFHSSPGYAWYGQDESASGEDGAVVRTSPDSGQREYVLETAVSGPKRLSFSWKLDSSSGSNALEFFINGEKMAETIAGGEWATLSLALNDSSNILEWVYTATDANEEDAGFLADLRVDDVDLPDYAFAGVDYDPGIYVLQRDILDITATGINLGLSQPLSPNFKIQASLVSEGGDSWSVPLGDMKLFRGLDSDNRFVYRAAFPLSEVTPEGMYHLRLEFVNTGEEWNTDNSVYFSAQADIQVERRPDIRIAGIDYVPGSYLVGEELTYAVTVRNAGLGDVPEVPFEVTLFLSESQNPEADEETELVTFRESMGIRSGESITYEITAPAPAAVRAGALYHVGAAADRSGSIPQSGQAGVAFLSENPDLIFGSILMEEAIDLVLAHGDILLNGVGGAYPWFGRNNVLGEGIRAAQTPPIDSGEQASFQLSIDLPSATVVSFFWRISSSQGEDGEDYVAFAVNGQERDRISGDAGWVQQSFLLEPGENTLDWIYVKNDPFVSGVDAAWVSHVAYQLPDLFVSSGPEIGSLNDLVSLFPGDAFPLNLTVGNAGPGGAPPYTFEVVLAPANNVSQEIVLKEVDVGESLAAGQSHPHVLNLFLPQGVPAGNYFIGVRVDPRGEIPEVAKGNNSAWTETASITVNVAVSLEAALDFDEIAPPLDLELLQGGSRFWFGQTEVFDGSIPGNGDAAQSPSLSNAGETWFETGIAGPAALSFRHKAATSGPGNYLRVTVDGEEKFRVSGNRDWEGKTVILPSVNNLVRWTYVQGADLPPGERETVYVDRVAVTGMDKPDFVIQSVDFEPGDYVLTRDRITITAMGRNQGADAVLPPGFKVTAKLTSSNTEAGYEASDLLLGDLEQFRPMDADNRFVYRATLPFPEDMAEGDYYLALLVDSDDVVEEFDETNNYFFSAQPDVSVVRLPDLVVENLSYTKGNYIYGEEITSVFTIRNVGLADVAANPFKIGVFLSSDRGLSVDDDLLVSFTETSGLPRGQSRSYQVTTAVPAGTTVGEFLSLGVWADTENTIAESHKENNGLLSEDSDIFVGELSISEAVDNADAEFSFSGTPWFGQKTVSSDGRDAAQSGKIGDLETSTFSTTVNLASPSVVSFYWKVSSERILTEEGDIMEDYLRFSINGSEQARISGEVDWRRVSFPLPAGSSTLSWSYVKDAVGGSGQDAGWVDQIRYTIPDLTVEAVVYESGEYNPGESFPMMVTVANHGNGAATSPFTVEARLSRTRQWGSEDDIVLGEFILDRLNAGESVTMPLMASIPAHVSVEAEYFVSAAVDAGQAILESDVDNNEWFSMARDVLLRPEVSLEAALDSDENDVAEDALWTLYPMSLDSGWRTGGARPWFGQRSEFDSSVAGNEDAARSGGISFNEEAWLEREIEVDPTGPAIVTFRWKVSSLEHANSLQFSISGVERGRISGDRDWEEVSFLIPAGPQVLRWTYAKTSSQVVGADSGFLDDVRIVPATEPDFVVTHLDFEPGEFVLQRDRLPVVVTVQNQGAQVDPGLEWLGSDIEVRLSLDKEWGNDDDIILGNFSRVDVLDSGNRLLFRGELSLPWFDSHEASYDGVFYLGARFAPFDKTVRSFASEVLWSDSRNVSVRRLPDLVLMNSPALDSKKIYYPYTPIETDFVVRNQGLTAVPGEVRFSNELFLFAYDPNDGNFEDADSELIPVTSLGLFPEQAFLPGVSKFPFRPDGSELRKKAVVTLPAPGVIQNAIGAENDIEDFRFRIEYRLDALDDIEEVFETNNSLFSETFRVYHASAAPTYGAWAQAYGLGEANAGATEDYSDDQVMNLLKYAFNLNPLTSDGAGGHQVEELGVITIDGRQYLRFTFNMVQGAADIVYYIETSSSISPSEWEPLMTDPIDPSRISSLTGVNGLTSSPWIISAADQGYTAAVTVRDFQPLGQAGSRFFRIRVEQKELD